MEEKCPNCGGVVPPQARFCPHCGAPIIPQNPGLPTGQADDGYARLYTDESGSKAGTPPAVSLAPAAPLSAPPLSAPASPVMSQPVTPPPTPTAPESVAAAPVAAPNLAKGPDPLSGATGAPLPAGNGFDMAPTGSNPAASNQASAHQGGATPGAPAPPYYDNGNAGGGNGGSGNNGSGNGNGSGYGHGPDHFDGGDEPRSRSFWPWIAAGGFLVAAAVGLYGFMQDGRDLTPISDNALNSEITDAPPQTVINPRVTLYAAADANVRDKPTVSGTKVVTKVKRGAELKGDIIAGAKGDQWLKLEGQEAYISLVNLVKDAPATLVSSSATDATIMNRCPVLARADANAPVKVTLDAGAKIRITGLTDNGYAEFALPRGGSGYVESEGKPCLSGGTPLAINFDPGQCDFGPEIEGFFKRIKPVDNEGDMSYATVGRSFGGVPVNSAFTAWETTGLTFDGSIAEVRAAFLAAGYKLDADNNFIPPADSEAVASASLDPRNPSDKRGRTQLSCGV